MMSVMASSTSPDEMPEMSSVADWNGTMLTVRPDSSKRPLDSATQNGSRSSVANVPMETAFCPLSAAWLLIFELDEAEDPFEQALNSASPNIPDTPRNALRLMVVISLPPRTHRFTSVSG